MKSERELVKDYIQENSNYKIADIQRLIKKGYIYTSKLVEEVTQDN